MPLERFGVAMDDELLARFDALLQRQGYTNRSEAIRDLVRRELAEDAAADPHAHVAATVVLLYDHHQPDLAQELTAIQHAAEVDIVCATHVHLTHRLCLEAVFLRGESQAVRDLGKRMSGLIGVLQAGVVIVTPTE